MPTPLSTILPASFLKPGWSVWKSFFSVSIPCKSFLSLRNSLPGPHVGRDAKEQTIFPPVALSDDKADSSVGSRAGSGFLTCEKRAGNCARRDVMMDLLGQPVSYAFMETGDVLCSVWVNEKPFATEWYEWIVDVWHNEHLSSFQIFLSSVSYYSILCRRSLTLQL